MPPFRRGTSPMVFILWLMPSSYCVAQSSATPNEVMRKLAMEHAACATFYLASSVCNKSNDALSTQSRRAFEIMMERAHRFAKEGGTEERALTIYGKELLEEMNEEMRGNCRGMPVLQEKYKGCKALAEDFSARGREITQELLHPH